MKKLGVVVMYGGSRDKLFGGRPQELCIEVYLVDEYDDNLCFLVYH